MIKKKRNRTNKDKEEDSLDLSQLEDAKIDIGIPMVNEVFNLNKQKLYLFRQIYKKLHFASINQLSFGDLWDMIDNDENNKLIKSKDDLDKVLKELKEENKIEYVETNLISLIIK